MIAVVIAAECGECAEEKTSVKSKSIELASHFEGADISFDYPKEWLKWEGDSFAQFKNRMKSEVGVDVVVTLESKDKLRALQIFKRQNPSTFDAFYQNKKEFADKAAAKGINSSLKKATLPNGKECLLGYIEDQNGKVGISFQFLLDGYEYNIVFMYTNAMESSKDEDLRKQIMNTLRIIGQESLSESKPASVKTTVRANPASAKISELINDSALLKLSLIDLAKNVLGVGENIRQELGFDQKLTKIIEKISAKYKMDLTTGGIYLVGIEKMGGIYQKGVALVHVSPPTWWSEIVRFEKPGSLPIVKFKSGRIVLDINSMSVSFSDQTECMINGNEYIYLEGKWVQK
jgi:hypothetical protein